MPCGVLNWFGLRAALADRLHPVAVLVELRHARVVVAVGHEDVALRIPGDVGRPIEHARPRRRRAFEMVAFLDEALEPVERLVLAAERHRHAAVGTVLDDHVRAFVDHPDVVFLVDADGVREAGGVVVRSPLLDELQARIELEEHRRRAALDRRGLAGASEHEQMAGAFLATPTASPMVWPGIVSLRTSSVTLSCGVLFSSAACFACCSGVPTSPPAPPRPAGWAAPRPGGVLVSGCRCADGSAHADSAGRKRQGQQELWLHHGLLLHQTRTEEYTPEAGRPGRNGLRGARPERPFAGANVVRPRRSQGYLLRRMISFCSCENAAPTSAAACAKKNFPSSCAAL